MTMVDSSVGKVAGSSVLDASDLFVGRHIGPNDDEIAQMLAKVGCSSLDDLADQVVPRSIRMQGELKLGEPRGEHELINELRRMSKKNVVARSYIGMGYHGTITPPVILRNVLENPGWYTQYTPYQAEIAQGRLQALLNFQTMITDLTGMEVAGASLLDEGTAAAEAMSMCVSIGRDKKLTFVIDDRCHPQTIEVIRTRAGSMGITVRVEPIEAAEIDDGVRCGPDEPGAHHAPGRVGRGHRSWQRPAVRRADGLRRAARGVPGDEIGAHSQDAGAHRGCVA